MLISMPAIIAIRVASFSFAATCHWVTSFLMSSQSETTNPLKPSLAFENVGQDVFIDVAGNAVDLGGVDHHGARAPALTAAAKVGRKYSRR